MNKELVALVGNLKEQAEENVTRFQKINLPVGAFVPTGFSLRIDSQNLVFGIFFW